jgi:hypothetical protein
VVRLDQGGVPYTTSLTTLRRFPDSMIGCMFSGKHALPLGKDEHFFIDRDGRNFYHILNFLRSPEGYKVGLEGREKDELRRECEYYGIDQLMFAIPCTEKLLECEFESKNDFANPTRQLSHSELSHVSGSAALPVLVDSQGVYTVRAEKRKTGKIEYSPPATGGSATKRIRSTW